MIRYCNLCGSSVTHTIPAGDSMLRHVCTACGHIQYENPRLIVGCIAEWSGKILLCRRAIEPRRGFWTLPAGFMENGESTAQAAMRETQEESGAHVDLSQAFAMFSLAEINQVHLFYRGTLNSPDHAAGEESLEVALFSPEEIPWHHLSFHSVKRCIELYLRDRSAGKFGFHEEELAILESHSVEVK
jgi:ADP-ribose pyrophosphatase YjhB (NUDIX family)